MEVARWVISKQVSSLPVEHVISRQVGSLPVAHVHRGAEWCMQAASQWLQTAPLHPTTTTIRYDNILHSKADMSQLNLPHGTNKQKVEKQKNWKVKTNMLRRIGKQSAGNPWSQSWRRKGKLRWEGFAEKEGFKRGMNEWGVTEY